MVFGLIDPNILTRPVYISKLALLK